jgi:aldose sugar dehydrogenase
MKRIALVIVIGLIVAAAALVGLKQLAKPKTAATPEAKTGTTVIADNLDVPWEIAWLPDGRALITERPGKVRVLKDGKLEADPILQVDTVEQGEGGLQGLAVDPDFASNKFIYIYVSEAKGGKTTNRVVRYREDGGKLVQGKVLVDGIPGNNNHNGGRLAFGPDKFLYVTTGDAQNPNSAQDKNSLAGKILRITTEGAAAPENPFGNRTYSYGHRNPQGLAWDKSKQLYETEHGPSGELGLCCRDEVNKIERGGNYGWPLLTGSESRFDIGSPIAESGNSVTWAPGGAVFGPGDKLYFATLKGEHLHMIVIEGGKVTSQKELYSGQFGRLRTVTLGPDGKLYLLTSNRDGRGQPRPGDDKVIRVETLPD